MNFNTYKGLKKTLCTEIFTRLTTLITKLNQPDFWDDS
jgi:hypothetical protein